MRCSCLPHSSGPAFLTFLNDLHRSCLFLASSFLSQLHPLK